MKLIHASLLLVLTLSILASAQGPVQPNLVRPGTPMETILKQPFIDFQSVRNQGGIELSGIQPLEIFNSTSMKNDGKIGPKYAHLIWATNWTQTKNESLMDATKTFLKWEPEKFSTDNRDL